MKPPLFRQDIVDLIHRAAEETLIYATEFTVGAGAACVMHGIRETTKDVDVSLPFPLYAALKSENRYQEFINDSHPSYVPFIEVIPRVDVHGVKKPPSVVLIDGVTCLSLEALLEQKLMLNREKDQDDIAVLKQRVLESKSEVHQLYVDGKFNIPVTAF